MNKRFSTLLAGVLLAGGMSANAQTGITGLAPAEIVSDPVRYYMLTTEAISTNIGKVIATENNSMYVKQLSAATPTDVDNQLWTIEVTAVSGSNRFILTNKATGMTLSFDPKYAIAADENGDVPAPTVADDNAYALDAASEDTEWTWVTAPNATSELRTHMALTCAFRTDSTMSIAVGGGGNLYAYKYANDKVPTNSDFLGSGSKQLTLRAVIPGSIVMTADDLNVLEDATNGTYFTLSTNKTGLKGDVVTGVKFHAADGTGTYANYVTLKELGTENYLRVDSAVHTASGTNTDRLYQLARKELAEGITTPSAANYFKIEKNLFTDSAFVSIPLANTRFIYKETEDPSGAHWYTAATNSDAFYNYGTLSSILLTDETEVMTFYEPGTPSTSNLLKENLLFALSAPEADNTLTTLADGVYYIKNKQGQYYAVPVDNAKNQNNAPAEWVTVNPDEQNVAHMPAYQWVVLKDATSAKAAPTSPVTFTNREFQNTNKASVQLRQNEGAAYFYGFSGADSVDFELVPAASVADSLLGYKYMDEDSLLVNRYLFNYLHAYADDKYLSQSADDSLAVVFDDKTPFKIKAIGDLTEYGFDVTDAVKARIPNLKQLWRQEYQIYVPGVKDLYLGYNKESKYAIAEVGTTSGFTASTFYFKENNDLKDGACYHALIDLDKASAVYEYSKAGVTDDDLSATLKHQVYNESRTSAFLIGVYDAPLYRRFNSALLEGNEGDASDTLRFVEKYRGEYLQMETNPNFVKEGIDFLGIDDANKAEGGLAFLVDTAWVNRGNGNIKPQYLISIDRTDQAFEAGEMCPVCQEIVANGGQRPANCPHDKAGKLPFHMGKYLVNFADSAANAVNTNDYKWAGYTRAGFVKAAHMGDSLFILKDQFADVTLATFDTAAIKKAVDVDKTYGKENIINLREDNHKLVTWSMRFLNPEEAATEEEEARAFLFESQGTTDIAPTTGSWLKMQNGCLVMSGSNGSTSTFNEITGGDDALIFNVEQYEGDDDIATDNEEISTSEVTVIAGNGQITISGAAGKQVVVSNILGQVVANTVLTSDNATIAAPQGVVVVAVEGEEAVKAIVK